VGISTPKFQEAPFPSKAGQVITIHRAFLTRLTRQISWTGISCWNHLSVRQLADISPEERTEEEEGRNRSGLFLLFR